MANLCRFLLVFWVLLLTSLGQAKTLDTGVIEVTDLAGRELRFDHVPQRIILGESRYLPTLAILDQDNPLERVVGLLGDLEQIDPGTYAQYREAFPQITNIPKVGHNSADSFSVEKVLTLQADLAIFGVEGHGPNARHGQLIDQLQRAGVQVVFIDFRRAPLVNAVKSVELLGKVLDRGAEANAFVAYYQQQLQRVTERLAKVDRSNQPEVFLHSRVGLQDLCCETMARGMMASFLVMAQGENVALSLIPGAAGVMNLEYLMSHQPDIYIGTAIGAKARISDEENTPPYIVLGAGVEQPLAEQSFQRAIVLNGISELTAVKSKKAYAIWHHFYNTPLNVVAVQVFAKWLYPELFKDLQPRQTLETLFARFQPVPLDGTYWVTLDGQEI